MSTDTTKVEVIKKKRIGQPPTMLETSKKEVINPDGQSALSTDQAPNLADWGVEDLKLNARDVMIPKIQVMQAMSRLVVAGEAKFGELRDSLNDTVMGDEKNPLEFTPFFMEKVYVVMNKTQGKFKFHHQEPITALNEGMEWEVTAADGTMQRWYRTMNFYVLLPKEIIPGKPFGGTIPYLLSFRSSSARAGKKLATTMFLKNVNANKTPAATTMQLFVTKTTNDEGTFMVFDVKDFRPSTKDEVSAAFEWVQKIRTGGVKVDHRDLEEEAASGVVTKDFTPIPGVDTEGVEF